MKDLKKGYRALTLKEAKLEFEKFKTAWEEKYSFLPSGKNTSILINIHV